MGRTNRHSALLLLEDLYVAGTATVISFRLGGLKEGQAICYGSIFCQPKYTNDFGESLLETITLL